MLKKQQVSHRSSVAEFLHIWSGTPTLEAIWKLIPNNWKLCCANRSSRPGRSGRQTGQSGGFDAILAQQLGTGTEQANAAASPLSPGAAQAGMISQMLLNGAGQSQAADPDAEVLQEAFNQASGTLDLWDSYAKTLGSSADGGSLRDAYALLQGIDSQVTQIKQAQPVCAAKTPVSIRC